MRPYLYAAILVFVMVSNAWSYHKGKISERQKSTRVALEFREKENRLVADLQRAQAKKEVIYLDRIKVVEKAVGQCLDSPIDPVILGELLKPASDPP